MQEQHPRHVQDRMTTGSSVGELSARNVLEGAIREGRPVNDGVHRFDPAPMLTAPEVARWLRLPLALIYELARTRRIPHARIGRQIRFDAGALNAWLAAGGSTDEGDAA